MRLERLSLEQGNMDGAPTQGERGEESERKRLTTKVNQVSVWLFRCRRSHSQAACPSENFLYCFSF